MSNAKTAIDAVTPLPPARELPAGVGVRRLEISAADGHASDAFYYSLLDAPAAGPVLVYLHGIQSHPGWFVGSCGHLAAAGLGVLAVTRRGSGADAHARGDATAAATLLADVAAAGRRARELGEGGWHLLGVSWGGKLAAAYAGWAPADVRPASLAMVAPGLVPQVDAPFKTKLAVAASLLTRPTRPIDLPLEDAALFTDNPPMRAYWQQDPWRLRQVTARFLYASRKLDRRLARARRGAIACPALLVLADRDRIIDNAATAELAERLTGAAGESVTLAGAHTLEFEPDPAPLYDTLARWYQR